MGGGFGGLQASLKLARAGHDVELTLVDRRNFHLFQPLAYQVATGALSPSEICYPLRTIFRGRENVDVLLADIAMPGEDGYSLIRRVRASSTPETASIPAVALTALAREQDRQQALRSGFQLHLAKPVDWGRLFAIIASFVPISFAAYAAPVACTICVPIGLDTLVMFASRHEMWFGICRPITGSFTLPKRLSTT